MNSANTPQTTEPPVNNALKQELRQFQEITSAGLAHLTLDELLHELLKRVSKMLTVDTVAILLLDRNKLVARAAIGLEAEVERGVRIPVGQGFAGRVAAERVPVFIRDLDHAEVLNPLLREKGLRSLLGVPLLIEGETIGVLHVGTLQQRIFTSQDADLLQLVADRVALAVQGARRYEHELVETMQNSLLPKDLPAIPGIELEARYLPAGAETEQLGGDWYDAFILPDGRLALAIGDVVGHGVSAANLMAQLRSGLRAYALDGSSPATVATRLNQLIRELERDRSATMIYALFDPDLGCLTLANAGHLPPLLVTPNGSSFIELAPSPPLGAVKIPSYEDFDQSVSAQSLLLFYTDGLIERETERLDVGFTRLRDAVSRLIEISNLSGDTILSSLLPNGTERDDVAILTVRSSFLENPLYLDFLAEPATAPQSRKVINRWLAQQGLPERDIAEIKIACGEATANAIEHAYSPQAATFSIELECSNDNLVIKVSDRGHWRPHRGKHRGRGLQLMEALMDKVVIERSAGGSTVTLHRKLGKEES